jgi:hypothetical protein
MSFDIPPYMEPQVQQFAQNQHISPDEAVIRLIEAGLNVAQSKPTGRSILGAFAGPEDSAGMDEALDLAMRDRERRHARLDNA